jgi:hypothetical protein
MTKIFGFTEEHVERINRTIRSNETRLPGDISIPAGDIPNLWVYLAQASESISAMDGVEPGSGEATVYRYNLDSGEIEDVGLDDITIYNAQSSDIPEDEYVLLNREPGSGQWFAQTGGGGARVVKFTATDTHSTYPPRAEYPTDTCTRYPAVFLPEASYDDTDICFEDVTENSPDDELVAYNLSDTYIEDGTIGLVWSYAGLWWTLGGDGGGSALTAIGKAGTDSEYPTEPCRRFPFYLLPDYTYENDATCDTTPTEGDPGEVVIALNVNEGFIPEDTICILHWFNDRWYVNYSSGGGGGELLWGLVQAGTPANITADAKATIPVKSCDIDGANEAGDEFNVYAPIRANKAFALWEDYVVGYIVDDEDNLVIVTDAYDDDIGTIKMWSGSDTLFPDGWKICDGTAYGEYTTQDLQSQFVIGYNNGTYGVGDTGGYEWHGLSENNHSDHEEHNHPLTICSCVNVADGVDHVCVIYDETATGSEDHPLVHDGPFNADADTDNKPPFTCLIFIERVN